MEWLDSVMEVKGILSKKSTFVPVSKKNLLSIVVLQQFLPRCIKE